MKKDRETCDVCGDPLRTVLETARGHHHECVSKENTDGEGVSIEK